MEFLSSLFSYSPKSEIEELKGFIKAHRAKIADHRYQIKWEREHMKGLPPNSKRSRLARIEQEKKIIADYQRQIDIAKGRLKRLKEEGR